MFLFLFFYFCAGDEEGTEKVNNSDNQTSTENVENSNQEVGSSQDKSPSLQEAVYEIIQEFGYADIYRWGGSHTRFSLIIWDAEIQDTFELSLYTSQAPDMAALILDYINAIMEAQDD